MTVQGEGASVTDRHSSALCTSCGLCCDGTLFPKGTLQPWEIEKARQEGGASLAADAKTFAQPCRFLRGTSCSIYDDRFQVCRRFRCELLKKLESGIVGLQEARAIVAEAKRWRSEALGDEPGDTSLSYCKRLQRSPDVNRQTDPHIAAAALKLAACRRFLVKHFLHPSDAKRWGWSA